MRNRPVPFSLFSTLLTPSTDEDVLQVYVRNLVIGYQLESPLYVADSSITCAMFHRPLPLNFARTRRLLSRIRLRRGDLI